MLNYAAIYSTSAVKDQRFSSTERGRRKNVLITTDFEMQNTSTVFQGGEAAQGLHMNSLRICDATLGRPRPP